MLDFLRSCFDFFWPWGVVTAAIGFYLAELAGYAYHRYFLHAMVLYGREHAHGSRLAFLFVPWKVAWEKHMWHHYRLYPDPDPPGGIEVIPFRPKHEYYNGLEMATHRFGSVPSEHPRFDHVEWLLHKIGLRISLDWLIVSTVFGFLVWLVMAWLVPQSGVAFIYFVIGGLVAGMMNAIWHASFHVLPYDRLRDVPGRAWFRPSVALANLGAHVPGFRRVYDFLFQRHLAHHYKALPVDDGNHVYRGVIPNANTTNFTMFNPLTDIMFGTYEGSDFEEIEKEA